MFILWSSSALRYLTLLFFISDEAPPYDSLSRDHSAEGDVTVPTRAVTATDVFVFMTGATQIPAVGLKTKWRINFSSRSSMPEASTCSFLLTLPTVHAYNEEKFRECLQLAFLSHSCFGRV